MNDEYFQLSQAFDAGIVAFKLSHPTMAKNPYNKEYDAVKFNAWEEGYQYATVCNFEDKCCKVAESLGAACE
ncbi:MAG: hypothetical protein E6R03_03675 [Hyphomicrobiaceae bacterium]|nr:MAG: hypothetical protein E6R03_03675 [Hyphomicrobiaceae bacterium]